jgi:hypothetical protein
MAVPSEAEIRAFAESIGQVDENGKYTAPRAQLAAGAQKHRELVQQAEKDEQVETTARRLSQLDHELLQQGFGEERTRELVAVIAPALIRRDGLTLKGTRTHE